MWLWAMTLTLDFQGQILIKPISQEWNGWLTWIEKDVSLLGSQDHFVILNFNLTKTLNLDFQGQILKKKAVYQE